MQSKVIDVVRSAEGPRDAVVELDAESAAAAAPGRGDEGALPLVAIEDGAADGGGDVGAVARAQRAGSLGPRRNGR